MDATQSLACSNAELNEFQHAYVTTALWSENDESGQPIDSNYSESDIHKDDLARMKQECVDFLVEASKTIQAAIDADGVKFGPDFGPWGRAGHDFFLTRNHAGVGFWDPDWAEPYGDQLTVMAHKFRECNLTVVDGTVYIM